MPKKCLALAEQQQECNFYLGYMGLFKALGKEFLIGKIYSWIFPPEPLSQIFSFLLTILLKIF